MAVTISLYNNAAKRLVNKEIDFTKVYFELLDNTASFTASHTTKTAVDSAGTKEVSGNGWTTGGENLSGVAVTTVTTNDAKLDADDIVKGASGGSIGPAYAGLLYDWDGASAYTPIAYVDFGGLQEAGDGTDFKVIWNASGIINFTY